MGSTGGQCGEIADLEGRKPINTLPHIWQHSKGIHEKERKWVRLYDTTWPWGSTQLCESTKSRKEQVSAKEQKDRAGNSLCDDKMTYLCISIRPRYLVNIAYTPASLHHLDVLDKPNRWRLLVSQSELICKILKGVSPARVARGDGGVEQRIGNQ